MWLLRLALRHWRPLALVAVIAALIAAGYAWKAHNAAQAAELAKAKAEVIALAADKAALQEAAKLQEAATQAADEARERNDIEIPRIRTDTQGRVSRAPTADPVVSLQDDNAALDGYGAARDSLRGTKPR